MHLRRIEIHDFKAIRQQVLQFEDAMGAVRPITVLAGPNGCGKTSVLYAIVQSLRGSLGARVPDVPLPEEHDVHRAEISGRRPVVSTVTLDLVFGRNELDAIQRVFRDTAEFRALVGKGPLVPPTLPSGRLRVTWQYPQPVGPDARRRSPFHLDEDPRGGATWFAGAKYAWGGFRRRRLSNPEDLFTIGMLRFFAQDRDRRWGLELEEEVDEGAGIPPADEGPDRNGSHKEVMTVREALRRLGEWAHGQGLAESDNRRKWEAILQGHFKRICTPKEYMGYWLDHARFGETPLLADAGREYPFAAAASGEHVVLHYLTQFTFPRPVNNSLILIDEPELHLHPRWIRQLYQALPQMGINNQFILVTHSPELKQLAAENNALVNLGDVGEFAGRTVCA